jgi:hypothetical protein
MCKIDYLGSGVCASGTDKKYVSFYPQGRMALYAALAEGKISLTRQAVAIADSCDLCGKCDYQCNFVTGMRPTRVMAALKELVDSRLMAGDEVVDEPENSLLAQLREIVGDEWCSCDRGITVAYAGDPGAWSETTMPACVVLPGSRDEVAALVRLCSQWHVPWVVRANGTNVLGFHLGSGVIIDLNRMNHMKFDEQSWSVWIGPGVSAFELQREAARRGFRVNVAEPAAMVCGSTMCSGILSLFSASYGTSADNYIDAEFVAHDGSIFTLNETAAPNLFAYHQQGHHSPGICTALRARLHPVTSDEAGVLVPFQGLDEAISFAGECARRRIGLAIGVLGMEYVSAFMAPTRQLASEARQVFEQQLGINCLVLIIGDRFALRSVAEMGRPLIDQRLFTTLSLGLPSLCSASWLGLISEFSAAEPFAYLNSPGFTELVETALAPSPRQLAQELEPDLRQFYEQLYARPELTNLVWLNTFRVTSSRVGREKHFFPLLMYLAPDQKLIADLNEGFSRIASLYGLGHAFGFITPVDNGKRCIYEYDYFFDHTDHDQRARLRQAAEEAGALIEEHTAAGSIRWLRYLLHQGFCRQENLLYA